MSTTDTPTHPSTDPSAAYHAPRRLTRPADDRKLGGVCAGIGRYANVDATLVRVLAVVVGVLGFPFSALGYLVLWALIPADHRSDS